MNRYADSEKLTELKAKANRCYNKNRRQRKIYYSHNKARFFGIFAAYKRKKHRSAVKPRYGQHIESENQKVYKRAHKHRVVFVGEKIKPKREKKH